MVKISYDREVDALYIRLKETTVTTDRVEEGIALDYDASDRLAGIEILDARKRLGDQDASNTFTSGTTGTIDPVGLTLSMSPQLSAIQTQILDSLRRIETEEHRLGDWYLGALYALGNPYNPDRISQAAQSLRELIEKLPRVVLESDVQNPPYSSMRQQIRERFIRDKIRYSDGWKGEKIDAKLDKTLRNIDEYLQLSQRPTRKEQIQDSIRELDPMAHQMGLDIQKRKRDAFHGLWKQLEGFAHHRSREAEEEETFREHLVTFEQIVFDLFAQVTVQDQQEIHSILDCAEHTDANAETLYRLISRCGANYVYFFTNVADPGWIPFLKEQGFFRNPPFIQSSSDGYINFPPWPELEYLKKVCEDAPDDVIQLVLALPDVDNPRVYDYILDIALQLDGEQSARLKPKMVEYAKLEHQIFAFEFPQLLAHWTADGETKAALDLAKILVWLAPDARAHQRRIQERDTNKDQDASIGKTLIQLPRFSENYQEILSEGVRPLAEKVPYEVARMLISTAEKMIQNTVDQHEDEYDETDDYTKFWCPRLVSSAHDDQDLGKPLVHTLTYACEMVYERASESIGELDRALRNQRWYLFKRIRQHLYASNPNAQTLPWIREMVRVHGDYGRRKHNYEFQRMIRLACEHLGAQLLTKDDRRQIFDAILCGPSEEDFREWLGDQFTETEFEKRRKYFHHQQLKPFASVLFGKYADYFLQLEADEAADEITDESYSPVTYSEEDGIVSSRSPRSADELTNHSDGELLDFINDWEDEYWNGDDRLTEITIEALAGTFQTVFKKSIIPNSERLNFWIKNRDNILRPIYVRAMINAMQEHVKAKDIEKLDAWFAFCRWVLLHPDSKNEEGVRIGRLGDGSRESPVWHTARRAVCDFVEGCIEEDTDVPVWARERLVGLLEKLCTQYDCRLDNEKPVLLNRDDQLTEAINTTRGRALDILVKFGYWVRNHYNNGEVPEIMQILEKRVSADAAFSLTLPEYAILGMRFGSLFHVDERWTKSRRLLLLPRNDLQAWREAFGNFLRYNRPSRPIFDELRGDYEFALEHLESLGEQKGIGRELTLKLGQHLFTYYLWDLYPLKGDQSLLERYYLKTDVVRKHWATLFNYVGHSLQKSGKQVENGLKQRIVAFFESRLESGDPMELREFAAWLNVECLDAEWRLNALSKVLDVKGILDETGTLEEGRVEHPRTWLPLEVARSMSTLLAMHTPRVVACFAKLTDALPSSGRHYIPTDDAQAILKAGLEHCDESVQKNAERAKDSLFSHGILKHTD